MNLLAIESATDMVGVAVIRSDGATAERIHQGGRLHAELLAPAVEEVCAASGCALSDIGAIAVDVGPGLFTGLRVGVATAKALGQGLGIGLVGLSSLDVLAAAARERAGDGAGGRIAAVVDARRSEVFASGYDFGPAEGGQIDPGAVRDDRTEPLGPGELVDWLLEWSGVAGPVRVVGDGALRYRPLLSVHPSLDLGLASSLSAPPPAALARLALRRLSAGGHLKQPAEVVPDYRRHADARINWEQRDRPRGSLSDAGPPT